MVVGSGFGAPSAAPVIVVALLLDRIALFVVGALAVQVGSVVSHSGSFFGFAEGGYDTDATIILKGYEGNLMPADYAKELEAKEIDALAAYFKAASGDAKSKEGGDGDGG